MELYGFPVGEKLLCIGIVIILIILTAIVYGRRTVEYFGNRCRRVGGCDPTSPPFEKREPSWTTIQPSPPIMPTSPVGSILLP
jgi:hypothetical protein